MKDVLRFIFRVLPSILCVLLVLGTSLVVGLLGHSLYWLTFDSFGRERKRAQRKLNWKNSQRDDEYYTIIVGAGFSGLGTAIKLNQLGMKNYVILERHEHLGGTWYANQYPGCACDVPSNVYSFSFEPNPNWSHYFGRQPEIRQYLEHCADKYRVRSHIRFSTTVTQMKWLEDRQLWEVTAESSEGEQMFHARFVALGSGPLSNASFPADIPGMDKFEGQMCHTSQWDKTIDVRGKRVAVIGTGASAIQAVPEIQKMGVEQLLVFQRTAPWVIPRVDNRIPDWQKDLFRRVPIIQKFVRAMIYWMTESIALSFVYRWPIRFANQQLVKYNLQWQVKDPALRKKVTPNWEFGCKRMLITNDWYSSLQKPNVQLVTNRIREIKPNSIVTYDEDEYPVEIIIWSTGFQVQTFSLPVYGINGRPLSHQWAKSLQAYRGITIPNFPNFFVLLGPNTGLGHNSVVIMIESQINYMAEAFLHMDKHDLRSIVVRPEAYEQYNRDIQSKLKKTVWQSGGCHSWYQDANGNNTTIWPDFTWMYILLMKNFDHENYITAH